MEIILSIVKAIVVLIVGGYVIADICVLFLKNGKALAKLLNTIFTFVVIYLSMSEYGNVELINVLGVSLIVIFVTNIYVSVVHDEMLKSNLNKAIGTIQDYIEKSTGKKI